MFPIIVLVFIPERQVHCSWIHGTSPHPLHRQPFLGKLPSPGLDSLHCKRGGSRSYAGGGPGAPISTLESEKSPPHEAQERQWKHEGHYGPILAPPTQSERQWGHPKGHILGPVQKDAPSLGTGYVSPHQASRKGGVLILV